MVTGLPIKEIREKIDAGATINADGTISDLTVAQTNSNIPVQEEHSLNRSDEQTESSVVATEAADQDESAVEADTSVEAGIPHKAVLFIVISVAIMVILFLLLQKKKK